jgi:23S rRNA (cytidine1920-2'-O)/16S rRNA (cytidine1409-2'-O)-methyltransferase
LPHLARGSWPLIKPQFEAGREAVGKGGIVRDAAARAEAMAAVRAFINATQGWKVFAEMPSPILSPNGPLFVPVTLLGELASIAAQPAARGCRAEP